MREAKTKLSRLVKAAERGEKVVLTRYGVAVAEIVSARKRKFALGFLKDEFPPISNAQLFAMSDEEADRFIDGKY